jgi:photosystem II stability/assembly factor-like uncharacterized protein
MRALRALVLAALGAAWAPAQFLPVGNVNTLIVSPDGALLAGTPGGVFRSSDAGRHWVRTGLIAVNTLALGPEGSVFATTLSGLARSVDGGLSWTESRALNCTYVLAVAPQSASTLYAGTCGQGVFKSTDAGRTWKPVPAGMVPNAVVWDLAFDPTDSNTLYAATGKGIFKSTDAGQHWQTSGDSEGLWTYCVAIDPGNRLHLYAGTNGRGILQSTDAGEHWTRTNSRTIVKHLAIDAAHPDAVYAATQGSGLLKSSDAGRSWARLASGVPDGLVSVLHVTIDAKDPRSVYAGTFGYGVFHSTDAGATWTPLNVGLQSAGILAVAVDPVQSNIVYAGTDSLGIFQSMDGGATWTRRNSRYPGGGKVRALGISAAWPVPRVYASDLGAGTLVTSDAGESWTRTSWTRHWLPQPSNWPDTPSSLAFDPAHAEVIYAAVYAGGVFQSVDGGQSWTAINNGFPNLRIDCVIVDPADANRLFAVGTQSIYRSDDRGQSWTRTPAPAIIRALAIGGEGATAGVWYAGGFGMFKSLDAGQTWTAVDSGLPRPLLVRSLAVDPKASGTVYAGTEGSGLYKTTDGGKSWTALGVAR